MRAAALAVLALAAAPVSAAAAELVAERVTEARAAALLVGGPDAIGGVGDWALGNGTLCAVVSDPSHETDLSPRGGVLVDLGHCGRRDDQFIVHQPLLNLSREAMAEIGTVRAEVEGGEARVITHSAGDGLTLETTYALSLARPRILRVDSRLRRVGDGGRARALGDVVLHVNRSLVPWGAWHAGGSPGFAHPALEPENVLSMLGAIRRGDEQVLVGEPGLAPPASYGIRVRRAARIDPTGAPAPLPVWSLQGESFSALAVFSAPLWWVGEDDAWLGWRGAIQLPFLDLARGAELVFERELTVVPHADVAAVQAVLDADSGAVRVHGRVDDASAVLHLRAADDGTPRSFVRPDPDGGFEVRVPPGRYALRLEAPGGRTLSPPPFDVAAGGDVELGTLALPPPARVSLPEGGPMRLVFVGLGGAQAVLGDDGTGYRGEEGTPSSLRGREVSLAGASGDPREVVLAPGRYRVLATRGPEYGVVEAELRAVAGATVALTLEPPTRAFATPGWIAADLHVHAAPSDDSALPLETQARRFRAAGAEVMVATDHEHVTDYGPVARALGLGGALRSVVGVEISGTVRSAAAPHTIGHWNAFPMPVRPNLYRKGAPDDEARRPRDVLAAVRALPGPPLVQLNHPRGSGPELKENAYLSHLGRDDGGFDPTVPLEAERNRSLIEVDGATGLRDLDFDAMELLNGSSLAAYRRVREDWFALLRQGEFRAATANSDSHRLTEPAAAPRNWVALADDDPVRFDEAAFVAAIRRGALIGSSGPFLDVRLGDAGVGDRFAGPSGTLRVAVRRAQWVPVSELRVYVDGHLAHAGPAPDARPVEVPLAFAADAFVTVELEGEAPAGSAYAELLPGFVPFAFTNPIFVDADGDGRWSPPGL